jgi:hypothetical protein
MNASRSDLDPSQMISRLDYTGQVERTNNPRREGNSHHAPDASPPTEAQNLPIARAAPQPIETCMGLEILRDRLLAQRTAGQPVEERMHPRQTGREEPVTHEPPHGQAGHMTRKFINLNHIVHNPQHGAHLIIMLWGMSA